jgi:hypothetical protein
LLQTASAATVFANNLIKGSTGATGVVYVNAGAPTVKNNVIVDNLTSWAVTIRNGCGSFVASISTAECQM